MILTTEQVEELTKKKRHAAQCRVLLGLGIAYAIRPDGSPVVLLQAVERAIGGIYNPVTKEPSLRL